MNIIVFDFFFETNSMNNLFLYIRCLENLHLKPVFRCTQYLFVFVWQVENTKWILCRRKIGVKWAY